MTIPDKAFRHGDIENILETLVKNAGRAASGGGLLGFAQNVIQSASGGVKFTKGDIKKVYFVSLDFILSMPMQRLICMIRAKGNWLRDYSQVCLQFLDKLSKSNVTPSRQWILLVSANSLLTALFWSFPFLDSWYDTPSRCIIFCSLRSNTDFWFRH
jgi:hypothetical protein